METSLAESQMDSYIFQLPFSLPCMKKPHARNGNVTWNRVGEPLLEDKRIYVR